MSVESPEALERSVLERKDREQLLAIAAAIGVKATSRAKKAEIIDKILTQTGHEEQSTTAPSEPPRPRANGRSRATKVVETTEEVPAVDGEAPVVDVASASSATATETPAGSDSETENEPPAEWELSVAVDGDDSTDED